MVLGVLHIEASVFQDTMNCYKIFEHTNILLDERKILEKLAESFLGIESCI